MCHRPLDSITSGTGRLAHMLIERGADVPAQPKQGQPDLRLREHELYSSFSLP